MTAKNRATRKKPSEKEIDEIVVAQADDDLAWEEPIQVEMAKATSLSIPTKLAARAAFLARLHREKDLEEWLTRVIRERVEVEETAFAEVKRELKTRQPA